MLRRRHLALLPALALPAASPARAQAWPDRPLRFIVPFPPGGPVDLSGRIMAQALAEPLGQNVVVENRSGAGGVVGVDAVAKAAPDGHTLAFASTGALSVNATLLPNLPYDPQKDLQTVSVLVGTPSLLVVRADSPIRDLATALQSARQNPGKLTYGSTGPGGTPHLAAELMKLRAGVDITHVAYRGAAPTITALIGGEIDMAFLDVPVLLPQVREGRLRALCVTAEARSAVLPDVPTIAEAGTPGVLVENWYAIMAPGGTPRDRVQTVAAAVARVMAQPELTRRFTDQGARIINLGPEAGSAFIRAETAKWAEVIRSANIKPE